MNLEEEKKTEGRNYVFRQRFERSLQKKIQKEERNRQMSLKIPKTSQKSKETLMWEILNLVHERNKHWRWKQL